MAHKAVLRTRSTCVDHSSEHGHTMTYRSHRETTCAHNNKLCSNRTGLHTETVPKRATPSHNGSVGKSATLGAYQKDHQRCMKVTCMTRSRNDGATTQNTTHARCIRHLRTMTTHRFLKGQRERVCAALLLRLAVMVDPPHKRWYRGPAAALGWVHVTANAVVKAGHAASTPPRGA